MPPLLARYRPVLAASLAILGVLATGFALAPLLTGLDPQLAGSIAGTTAAQREVRIAVSHTPLSTPVILAQHLGFFKDAGVDVRLIEYNGGDLSFDAMINGEVDLATSSDSVVVFNSFKHRDFVLLGTFVHSDNDIKIITRNSSRIKSAQDLVGTTAAVIKGSASEYFLRTFLTIEGIAPNQVTTVYKSAEEMHDALNSGEVDSIVIWEPFAYRILQQEQQSVAPLDTKALYSLTFNLVSSRSFADDNQQLTSNILRAIRTANRFIYAEPEQSKEIIQAYLQLDKQFVDWLWSDYLFSLTLNESLVLTLEEQVNWAINSGLLEEQQAPDFRLVIDSRAYDLMKRDLRD
ncbi:MAG: ABC transporter substrate-binding protein [Gammaproteobacteria bacterium]|nr:ABC transporter substrate-binding protein [Gammaproteobacteria bacterium]